MSYLFEGLLNNVLLTVLSCILPIAVGILALILCQKHEGLNKKIKTASLLFESLCPMAFLMLLYFCIIGNTMKNAQFLSLVVCFSISFIGYIPRRYDEKYSFGENIVIHSLGLISAIFKWSFCAGMILVKDMLSAASSIRAYTFEGGIYWVPLLISFIILLGLELTRYILKERVFKSSQEI